ncbi:MAG: helix-turn-helix domain-containing protein [Syntrophales bacterium]|nr:helix-turn-helix domain-containing protein [Syntrophales bacterium]
MANQGKQTKRSGRESPSPLKRYYRPDEVAAYFDISERTVYRLLDEGDLQATHIRRCLRISTDEIRRFEESLEEETEQRR